MKKDSLYLDKFFIAQLFKSLLLQALFVVVMIYFAGAGHGTYSPFSIFYGIFSLWFFFDPLSHAFFLVPIIFLLVSILILVKIQMGVLGENLFKLIFASHLFGSLIGVYFDFQENVEVMFRMIGITISLILSFLFWRIFFQVLKRKQQI